MPDTSRQDFNEQAATPSIIAPEVEAQLRSVAAKAAQEFPGALDNLLVIAAGNSGSKVVYATPAVNEDLWENVPDLERFVKEYKTDIHNAAALTVVDYKIGGRSTHVIAMNAESSQRNPQNSLYVLLHEIGHNVTSNGHDDHPPYVKESAADAFATLVYLQKRGKGATEALHMREQKALGLLTSDIDHYTSDTIQGAMDFAAQKGDGFYTLSLRDLAVQAARIAEATAVDHSKISGVYKAYVAAQSAFYIQGGYAAPFAREIINVMNAHKNEPDIFLAGKRALNFPLVKKVVEAQAAAKDDPFWHDALKLLDTDAARKPAAPRARPVTPS